MSATGARATAARAWPLVLALLAAAVAGGGALLGLRGGDASRQEVARLYEMIGLADDLLASLVDAETGQRGFLLTGEDRYLEPYEAAKPRQREDLARLRALAAAPAQRDRLARVEELAAAKLTELERTIALRRAGDAGGALALVLGDEGKRAMDALRAALGAFEAEERAALADRLEGAAHRSRLATALVAAGLAALLALGGAAAFRLLRAAREGRARAETALGLREAQLRAVFEGAPVGLSVHDRALRFLGVNERLAEVNGRPAAEHMGRAISEVLPAPLGAEVEAAHRRVVETGEALRDLEFDGPGAGPSGPPRHYLASYHPLRDPGTGEVGGLVAAVVEVTALRRAEGALRALNRDLEARVAERTAQLAEVAAELDAFAYTVSHDLRAPLRAMEGFARILEEEHGEALDAAGRRHARRIVEAAERLDGLIQDLLAYSRLSRAEIEARPVSLEEAVDKALADLPDGAAEVSVERPLPAVMGARPVLGAVLGNLLSNAVKFAEAGRRPRVRVRAEARPGGRVRLWVEDDGIGIAPEHLDRIFQVFERLHGQEHYPGTGIGLAIVRKGAERLGGRAGAESGGPGRGSRFWFELPGTAGA